MADVKGTLEHTRGTKLVLVLLCKEHWLSELSSLGTGVPTFLGRGVYLSRPVRYLSVKRKSLKGFFTLGV